MNTSPKQHLTEDELLTTLVNRVDLIEERRLHLEMCSQCQSQAHHLEQRFHGLGAMARKMAPEPARIFRLPDRRPGLHRWSFRMALATGVVGGLLLAITFLGLHLFVPAPAPQLMASADAEADKLLMARIDELVEDALPKPYQKLVAVSDPILTDDLIDWIVPSIDEELKGPKPQA